MLSMRPLSTRVVPCLAFLLAAAVPAGAEGPPTYSRQVAGNQLGNAGFSFYRFQFEQALHASAQNVEESGRNVGEEEEDDTRTTPTAAANGDQVASSPRTSFETYVYGLSAWLSRRAGSGRYTSSQGTYDATTPTPYRFAGAAGRAWRKPTGATSVVGAPLSPSQTSQPVGYDGSMGLSQAAGSAQLTFDTGERSPTAGTLHAVFLSLPELLDHGEIQWDPAPAGWPTAPTEAGDVETNMDRLAVARIEPVTDVVAPEPSTWVMLATGLVALGVVALRRKGDIELEEAG